MTLGKLIKNIILTFVFIGCFMGMCFMGLEYLYYGEGHATFYGYQITTEHNIDDKTLCHACNTIIIKSAKKYEIHHDTPIAIYDKNSKTYYIYRIISKKDDKFLAVGKCGEIVSIGYKEIVGKIIEHNISF